MECLSIENLREIRTIEYLAREGRKEGRRIDIWRSGKITRSIEVVANFHEKERKGRKTCETHRSVIPGEERLLEIKNAPPLQISSGSPSLHVEPDHPQEDPYSTLVVPLSTPSSRDTLLHRPRKYDIL